MTAKVLFLDGIRGHRDEAREPAPVYVSEPLPILADGSFGELCAICDAFGRLCCKLHQEDEALSRASRNWSDEDAPPRVRPRWQGDGEER